MKTIDRKADYPINPLILNRFSPRAMNGQPLDGETIHALFEAARWAPSAYNSQPWRFIYAKRGTKHFDQFMDLLVPFNQSWCVNAALLTVVISRKTFEHNQKPSPSHSYSTGAAWENLALEATSRELVVHGMSGFDYDKAKKNLNIPDEYEVLAMFAVGHPGPIESLPEALREQEVPSSRKKVAEIMMEGQFRP